MATSLRHFTRFGVRIFITEKVGGDVRESETFTEFVCAYSLKLLEISCRVGKYLPTRFCKARLEFYIIEPEFSGDVRFSRDLIIRNIPELEARIMRNIVFILTLNHYTQL